MQKSRFVYWAKCAVAATAIPFVLYAYASGPLPRHTGAPGDTTCAECHSGTAVNSSNGAVQITYSGGTSYVPGERGKFTVTITDTNGRQRWGFQASARLASNLSNGQAGTLIAGTGTFVQCNDGRDLPCRAGQEVQFIQHSAASTRGTFEFEWTAPAEGAGNVQVFVAGNAANGNGQDTGDRIYTSSITLTPQAASGNKPAITSGGVVNTWSGSTTVATNTWVAIYGTNLSTETRTWDGSPEFAQGKLPLTLGGVSVTIGGKSAPVYFVSPGQVNVLIPDDTNMGNLPVVVKNAAGESAPVTTVRAASSPALLTVTGADSKLHVIGVLNASNPAVILGLPAGNNTRPFRPGDVVQFYATGLGPTNPALPVENTLPSAPALVNAPQIRINNVSVQILGSALVAPGQYQVNGVIPDLPDGDHSAVIEVGGVVSPTSILLTVQR